MWSDFLAQNYFVRKNLKIEKFQIFYLGNYKNDKICLIVN